MVGQVNSDSTRNEIGINIYKFISSPDRLYMDDNFYHNIINGLFYKRHFDKTTFRLGLDYIRIVDEQGEPECCDKFENVGKYKGINLRIGMEKEFKLGQFRSFIATDFLITYGLLKGVRSGGIAGIIEKYEVWSTGIGIGPTLGLNYRFQRSFSISIETNFFITHFIYSNEKKSDALFQPLLNPVRMVSINGHF